MPLVVRPAATRTSVGLRGGKKVVKPRYHCVSQLLLPRPQYGAP